jgi:hypothetical protein
MGTILNRTEPTFKPDRREQLEAILECESDRALVVEILIEKYPKLLHVDVLPKKDLAVIPPNGIQIGDETYFGLATKPWRALEFILSSRNRVASMNDLAEYVWEDHAVIATYDMRDNLRKQINNFCRHNNITSFHVEGNGRHLCICEGPPRPKKSFDDSHEIPRRLLILKESGGKK